MCQSKSNGGLRCDNHTKTALADSNIQYSKLVQQECLDKGIAIAPECFGLTHDEAEKVDQKAPQEPAYQKALKDNSRANLTVKRLQDNLSGALLAGDKAKFAQIVQRSNPELKAIFDDNETRKREFAEDMESIKDPQEREEAIAYNNNSIALLKKRKERLEELSNEEAEWAFNTYQETKDSTKAIIPLNCVQGARRDAAEVNAKSIATIKTVRERMEETIISNKLKSDPGFKAAESSDSFRNSDGFKAWDSKHQEIKESYKLTNGYQKKIAATISSQKKAGIDTTEMEAAYKELNVRKSKFALRNIVESHGAYSEEANAARIVLQDARTKQYTF